MKKYRRVNKIIDEYLKQEDVELSNNYISAYTLYNIIKLNLEILKDINTNSSFIPKDYKLKINSKIDIEKVYLEFFFKKEINRTRDIFIRGITWNKKTNTYSFKSQLDEEFMNKNYDEIIDIFNIKQKYCDDYKIINTAMVFNNSIFDVMFFYDEYGNVDVSINVNKKENMFQLKTEFLFLYILIIKKINKNKVDILKKFPIEIRELNESVMKMVEDYQNNNGKHNIKKRSK